jgi:hypothetical protein
MNDDAARPNPAGGLDEVAQHATTTRGEPRPQLPGLGEEWSFRPHRDPYVISAPEAADLLGISKDLAHDLARRNELACDAAWRLIGAAVVRAREEPS